MAVNYKAGTVTSPTSTGNWSTTDVGFLPEVLILVFEKKTSAGSGVDYLHGIGFGYDATHRLGLSSVYLDAIASGTANMARSQSASAILHAYNTTTGAISAFLVADLVSLDALGFTLNFSTVQASGYLISYIAIGGVDFTNAFIKSLQNPSGTGSQAYTGVGFKPDFLLAITNSESSLPATAFNAGARIGLGLGTASAHKATAATGDDEIVAKTQAKGQKTDIILAINSTTTAVLFEATLTSLDSDGFTWNWTTVSVNRYVHVLCLKGGNYKVGTFNQATSTGNQSITDVGFTPIGVLLASANAASTTSISTVARHSLGAHSGPSARWATWLGASGAPSVADHYHDNANLLQMYTEGTPTQVTTADIVSNDSGGWTQNNTTVDATSREVLYWAYGNSKNFGKPVFGRQAVNRAFTY